MSQPAFTTLQGLTTRRYYFAAVVLLQPVEASQLDFDTPVETFGIDLKAEGYEKHCHSALR